MQDHNDFVRKGLDELRKAQREAILSTRGADWRTELPIIDAMARAEGEENSASGVDQVDPSVASTTADVGAFVPVDTYRAEPPQVSIAKREPTPTMVRVKKVGDAKRARAAVAAGKPDTRNRVDRVVTKEELMQQPAPNEGDTVSLDTEVDTAEPDKDAQVAFIPATPVTPRPIRKSFAVRKRESQEKKALQETQAAENQQQEIDPVEAEPIELPPPPKPKTFQSLPFLGGTFRFGPETYSPEVQNPDVGPNDGKWSHEDVAMDASFTVDSMESTAMMLMDTLGRITSACVKMQNDLNIINEILDRSFGS